MSKLTPIESGSPWKKLDCTPSSMKDCKQHIIGLLFITRGPGARNLCMWGWGGGGVVSLSPT